MAHRTPLPIPHLVRHFCCNDSCQHPWGILEAAPVIPSPLRRDSKSLRRSEVATNIADWMTDHVCGATEPNGAGWPSAGAQGLSANLTNTASIITQLQDFSAYLDALDPAAASYAALPNPKSTVLAEAQDSITGLVDDISSVPPRAHPTAFPLLAQHVSFAKPYTTCRFLSGSRHAIRPRAPCSAPLLPDALQRTTVLPSQTRSPLFRPHCFPAIGADHRHAFVGNSIQTPVSQPARLISSALLHA